MRFNTLYMYYNNYEFYVDLSHLPREEYEVIEDMFGGESYENLF